VLGTAASRSRYRRPSPRAEDLPAPPPSGAAESEVEPSPAPETSTGCCQDDAPFAEMSISTKLQAQPYERRARHAPSRAVVAINRLFSGVAEGEPGRADTPTPPRESVHRRVLKERPGDRDGSTTGLIAVDTRARRISPPDDTVVDDAAVAELTCKHPPRESDRP
jgi:hypothetical protein